MFKVQILFTILIEILVVLNLIYFLPFFQYKLNHFQISYGLLNYHYDIFKLKQLQQYLHYISFFNK